MKKEERGEREALRKKIEMELYNFLKRQGCVVSDFGCIARLIISIWELDPYREDEAHQKALFRRLKRKRVNDN